MSTAPIRFGIDNHVEISSLSAVPAPITNIDWLKNDYRSRQVRFNDFSNPEIVITGVLEAQEIAEYIAIPGSNLIAGSRVKLELYETDTSTVDLLNMDFEDVAQPIPLGLWSSGVDPYGDSSRISLANIFIKWLDTAITYQKFVLRIEHNYSQAAPVTNTIPRQDDVTGIVSLDPVTGVIDPNGNDGSNHVWQVATGLGENGGDIMYKTGTGVIFNANDGPRVGYTFTAAQTGTFDLWVKVQPNNDSNSVYTLFDGIVGLHIIPATVNTYGWYLIRSVNLTAEQDHELIFASRDWFYYLERIVIQPSTADAPTGDGPAFSPFGTITSSENVSVRSLMIGRKLELEKNLSYGNSLRFLTEPELEETASGYSVSTRPQSTARNLSLVLEQATEADRQDITEMEITTAGRSFIVSAYPETNEFRESTYTMLCKHRTALKYIHVFEDIYNIRMNLAEA